MAQKPKWQQQRKAGELVLVSYSVAGVELTLYVAGGTSPGPTLAVLAGVHGDEYSGPMSIAALLHTLPLTSLTGTLLAVPVANPPAFAAAKRRSPLDGRDLARSFPGSQERSPSESLAALLTKEVISQADALIDLHDAGIAYEAPLLVGFCNIGDEAGVRSRNLALAFGAPIVWEHPEVAPGRTLSVAQALGIPSLYTEARGGGTAPDDIVECYRTGVLRVMCALGMLPGNHSTPRPSEWWRGSGNTDLAVKANVSGLFRCHVKVGQDVASGDLIGEIINFDGRVLEQLYAPTAGVVAFLRRVPFVEVGDALYLLTERIWAAKRE